MAKPKIIIADTAVDFISPILFKMVEDFYEKVDLEIITDKAYFDSFMSTPQQADIVIVAEELFDKTITRHDFSYIFVMTEQYEEGVTDSLNVNYIYKYTSIKEIFNEITSKSGSVLKVQSRENQETQVVLLCSAAGGTGKTSVAMGIAASLTKNYKKVLYINAASLQCFSHMLGNKSAIGSTDVYTSLASGKKPAYECVRHVIRHEHFSYLPPFKAALMSMGLDFSVYERLVRSAKKSGEYDFIIVDADCAFDVHKAQLMNMADRVIIITTQSRASVTATNTLVQNINGTGSDKYIFLCSDFKNSDNNALIDPEIPLSFTVTDYVEHVDGADNMDPAQLARQTSIQRISFLLM